ncbi:MAG: hypothetical protein RJB11_762 [Planctomycetota bacterium]
MLVLSETVLVLEGTCWGVVDIQAKYEGSTFLEKVITLNRFSVFEFEFEFEYEYEQEHEQEQEQEYEYEYE